MHLLTWHTTLVCFSDDTGHLRHDALPLAEAAAALDLHVPAIPGPATISHPQLGSLRIEPLPQKRSLRLLRDGLFLCADPASGKAIFDRKSAAAWEEFLPITSGDVADLGHIASCRWIVRETRRVIGRGRIRLADDFILQLGLFAVDLRTGLNGLVAGRDERGLPSALSVRHRGSEVVLVVAEPRGSALLDTAMWPVRSRRIAEILALASHRQITGYEPPQDAFERDTAFLQTRLGAPGLEDLLETLQARRAPVEAGVAPAARQGAAIEDAKDLACPVVALGTSCVAACTLRSCGFEALPMPFDWLTTTPAMIRHCLETDFAVLLDRRQYSSLTGLNAPGEPHDGCDHLFYKSDFGINRLFNHNDPTREADYRYTAACVDRLRDLLAADRPKLFLQCSDSNDGALRNFHKTVAVLDSLTEGARLLQFEVTPPDRRLTAPLLSITAARGRHILYRLQPTSKMGGEFFAAAIDAQFLGWVIASNAQGAAALEATQEASRAALRSAMRDFDAGLPAPGDGSAPASTQSAVHWANQVLQRFRATAGLGERIRFDTYDRSKLSQSVHKGTLFGEIVNDRAILRFADDVPPSHPVVTRALTVVTLLDATLAAGPLPDATFLADLADGTHINSMSFCSTVETGCLVPDPDFVMSTGYAAAQAVIHKHAIAWADRKPALFWRGATTGMRRRSPPPAHQPDDFSWLPRLDLCRRARDSALAAHYDCGITSITQTDDAELQERIAASGLCRPPVGREGFLGYKAILVIDGNSNAWSALFNALLTGSCVLLVQSPQNFRQWYYHSLVAWENYVPVSADLEDLDERLSWVLAHDSQAQAIGEAGQRLAKTISFEAAVEDAALRLRQWLPTAVPPMRSTPRAAIKRRPPGEAGVALGHIQGRGDVSVGIEDWLGEPGSGRAIEGIAITLSRALPAHGFGYSTITENGSLSERGGSGAFRGTRGASLPLYGVLIETNSAFDDFDVQYEGIFVDGWRTGPLTPGTACAAPSGKALEAFRLSIVPRAAG